MIEGGKTIALLKWALVRQCSKTNTNLYILYINDSWTWWQGQNTYMCVSQSRLYLLHFCFSFYFDCETSNFAYVL